MPKEDQVALPAPTRLPAREEEPLNTRIILVSGSLEYLRRRLAVKGRP